MMAVGSKGRLLPLLLARDHHCGYGLRCYSQFENLTVSTAFNLLRRICLRCFDPFVNGFREAPGLDMRMLKQPRWISTPHYFPRPQSCFI